MQSPTCVVSWPSAPLTERLVIKSLQALTTPFNISPSIPESFLGSTPLVQWSSYDSIDHELTHSHRQKVLSSSYTFRKALIRKHFLSRSIFSYITKRPNSSLKAAIPQTFEIEIAFADELDELWADGLWDLGEALETSDSWWILKPGMSDRGMGIRLFNSKETLRNIFMEFEDVDSEDSDSENIDTTAVITSQLRHFVIQKYISNPLLFNPADVKVAGSKRSPELHGYKFHLRAYCVASGALQVYLYDRILALFAAVPYIAPETNNNALSMDLAPHLTNTSLQVHEGEKSVRLLEELVGCQCMPSVGQPMDFRSEDMADIIHQMVHILSETFNAALENPIHFQPLSNAFELYGVDFLIAYTPMVNVSSYQVKLLEINAEPAIEMTGMRLTWVLEDLFVSIGRVCVGPFLMETHLKDEGTWDLGGTRHHLIKCLDKEVRKVAANATHLE